jgi:hypothetical protein
MEQAYLVVCHIDFLRHVGDERSSDRQVQRMNREGGKFSIEDDE